MTSLPFKSAWRATLIIASVFTAVTLAHAGASSPMPAAQNQFELTSPDPAERATAACELGRMGVGARASIPQLIALMADGTPLPPQIHVRSVRLQADLGKSG